MEQGTLTPIQKMVVDEVANESKLADFYLTGGTALLERFDPKDFVDLFYLLQSTNLENIRKDAETKFGVKIGGIFLGGELAKVGRIEALPKMLKPLTIAELKEFFSRQIKSLSSEILE